MEKICYNCFNTCSAAKCEHCGYEQGSAAKKYTLGLPEGSVLDGRYIIGRVLGQGGFGITYVAQDFNSKHLVAVKEYFPDSLVTRSSKITVSTISSDRRENFEYGKECFLGEAKTLAKLNDHPNIVHVYSYFEENNTAYFSMEYLNGESLLSYLNRKGKLSWDEARQILAPVMDALEFVHSKGIIHRDVSPDNIFLCKDGTVKLIDFGAARYSLGDRSQSLSVVLKHGFAPHEQYARRGKQGPYTDIYALAATMYRAVTGRIPPEAIDRIYDSSLPMMSSVGVVMPKQDEDALLKALAVHYFDRFQNIDEFRKALTPLAAPKVEPKTKKEPKTKTERTEKKPESASKPAAIKEIPKSKPVDRRADAENPKSNTPDNKPVRAENKPAQAENKPVIDKKPVKEEAKPAKQERKPAEEKKKSRKGVIAVVIILIAAIVAAAVIIPNTCASKDEPQSTASEANKLTACVPSLVGKTESKALSSLKKVNLEGKVKYEHSEKVDEGKVISQDTSALSYVEPGTTITFTVSSGPQPQVPSVVGKTKSEAKTTLENMGLKMKVKGSKYSTKYKKGVVISQSPKKGTDTEKGETVSVTLSKGEKKYKVPYVLGMTESNAKYKINYVKLKAKVTYAYSSTVAEGRVISQSPAAGAMKKKGADVTIKVSLGEEETEYIPQPTYYPDPEPEPATAGNDIRY